MNLHDLFIKTKNSIISPPAIDYSGKINLKKYSSSRNIMDKGKICHAPFKSIRFEQSGIVKTCCYNDTAILGKYPEKTVEQIWFGEVADELREKISKKDLSFGCELCAQQLLNGEHTTVKSLEYDNLKFNKNKYPIILDFSLHNTCNLECVMCNGFSSSLIRKHREGLPTLKNPYQKDFIKELVPFVQNAETFYFAGGEPFLITTYSDIFDLIIKYKPNASVSVTTNGTVLNNRTKKILEKLNLSFTISIDSFTKDTYEKIRKRANFEELMENFEFFRDYCNKRGTFFAVNVCPIQQNWEEIPEMVSTCIEKDITIRLLGVYDPPSASLMSLPHEKLSKILDYYKTFNFPVTNNRISENNRNQFQDLIKKVTFWNEQAKLKEENKGISTRSKYSSNENNITIDRVIIELEKILVKASISEDNKENLQNKFSILVAQNKNVLFNEKKLLKIKNNDPEKIVVSLMNLDQTELNKVLIDHLV